MVISFSIASNRQKAKPQPWSSLRCLMFCESGFSTDRPNKGHGCAAVGCARSNQCRRVAGGLFVAAGSCADDPLCVPGRRGSEKWSSVLAARDVAPPRPTRGHWSSCHAGSERGQHRRTWQIGPVRRWQRLMMGFGLGSHDIISAEGPYRLIFPHCSYLVLVLQGRRK